MGKGNKLDLHVNVPSFFRCPISLEVMRSPVSLCTGVTYDRASIQAWLDAGHNTCPATMQVLPTTDFVPNLTLRRLINLGSHRHHLQHPHNAGKATTEDLVRRVQSSADPLPLLYQLSEIADDPSRTHELAENPDCIASINAVLVREGLMLEAVESAVRVLSPVLLARKDRNVVHGCLANSRTVSSLLAVLKGGNLESRVAAAWIVEHVASGDAESKILILETDGLLAELLRLLTDEDGQPADPRAVDAALSCLVAVASHRRLRPEIVRLGAVPALGKLLSRQSTAANAVEKALRLMKAAADCPEGRAAIGGDPATVAVVVGRVTRASPAATESAVAVLWSVCHVFRDRRAQEAVMGSNGLTKILLFMQSNCSPVAREMAGDLLRIFQVNSKGCLPGFEFKTTHIMPF